MFETALEEEHTGIAGASVWVPLRLSRYSPSATPSSPNSTNTAHHRRTDHRKAKMT